ncbi:MAG: hypothetical protein M3680_12380 [Myxococcota bacterium]|nr:hypothetical protein [Myxococcota bacterium]
MKASKRRDRAGRKSKQALKQRPAGPVIVQPAFSADEEAFFREGAELSAASSQTLESFADLDAGHVARPSLWRRFFARDERTSRRRVTANA